MTHHTIRDALSRAIYAEIGASNFYARMASRIANPEGSRRFEELAGDERGHRETLEGWYERLVGEAFEVDEGAIRASEIGDIPIADRAGALEALDIAIEAESKARTFYLEQARRARDAGLREMFERLADQEQGHYDLLGAERNAIVGGFYWFDMDSAGFLED
ncbi:MAG: ferritin family protein [Candidatus Krumholzibacteria bacterium]|nr:ferritin family protein [Candidatus Krumholzibacteria bacterium]